MKVFKSLVTDGSKKFRKAEIQQLEAALEDATKAEEQNKKSMWGWNRRRFYGGGGCPCAGCFVHS